MDTPKMKRMVRSSSAPPCAPRKKHPWINRVPCKAHLNNARMLNNRLQKVIDLRNHQYNEKEIENRVLKDTVQHLQSKLKTAGDYGKT